MNFEILSHTCTPILEGWLDSYNVIIILLSSITICIIEGFLFLIEQ